MSDRDFITPNTDMERVDLIQRLCKGAGLMGGKTLPYARFGVSSAEAFYHLLDWCFLFMPEIPARDALAFAFGVRSKHTTLMERRRDYASKSGLSLSTVIRLEHTGAIILDDYVRRFTDLENPDAIVDGIYYYLSWLNDHAEQAGIDPDFTNRAFLVSGFLRHHLSRSKTSRASK